MRITLRSLLLLSALFVFTPGYAADTDTASVSALRGFFSAVANKDYAGAWAAFTRHSQDMIVDNIASSEKMSAQDVRKLMDDNDQRIRDGFWESFRQSSKPEEFINLPMASGGHRMDADDSVVISFSNGATATVLMYHEGGVWKVGWMETFFPGGKVTSQ